MAVKLQRDAVVTLDHDDVAAVLNNALCSGSFAPFPGASVKYVRKNDSGQFLVTITPSQPEQAKAAS